MDIKLAEEKPPKITTVSLARAVEDVCLFGITPKIDSCKSYKIVKIIYKAIKKGLERDGKVVIPGFGRFYISRREPKKYRNLYVAQGVIVLGILPPYNKVLFKPCTSLLKSLTDPEEEQNGTQGND